MQALLSFEQAPPIAAPFRFFLTAPLFSALAGVLLLTNGAEIFSSRWSSAALAATHLITVGFMLQVMIGAMVQILPVVAGANLGRPLLVASVVHGLMVPGTLALIAGFLGVSALAFPLALLFLVAGIGLFLVMAARSLHGVPSTSATIAGFKRALLGLLVVVVIGFALVGGLEGHWSLAMMSVTRMHVAWGLGAWGLGLLSAIAYVVVPMFQITPQYPVWFSRSFGGVLLASVMMASLALLTETEWLLSVLEATIVWMSAGFCAMTLWLQARSKRARPDLTQRFWRLGLFCGLVACLLWGAIRVIPVLEPQAEWPLAFGGAGAGRRFHVGHFRHALQDRSLPRLAASAEPGERQGDGAEHENGAGRIPNGSALLCPSGQLRPACGCSLLANRSIQTCGTDDDCCKCSAGGQFAVGCCRLSPPCAVD
jgi:hypothetical protein